ncbi:MAG TPA: alpha/beta hydrolase [Luteimonas sp.]|nr:alpha/beta hydrolase [Luteimonas sp.]
MRSIPLLVSLLAMATVAPAALAACPAPAAQLAARATVADLGRILAPGGIQETYTARIGGIDQWVDIRGQDRDNPVILFVHGGPASPVVPTMWQFQRPIEEYFTVVHYDQRGAGRTFRGTAPDALDESLPIQRYVDDAIEMAEHARARLGKDKLVLVGHSWGTIIAMRAALARPDLFHAYVGIGQVIDTRENERLSFDYGMQQALAHGNAAAVAEMRAIAPYPGDAPITRERIVVARKWAQFYGGLSAYRDASTYFFEGPKLSPEYACDDVAAIDQGSLYTLDKVLPEFLAVDFDAVDRFPIPVVMFMGRHDYTTPSAPPAAWLARVRAPSTHAVWFEHSAHMVPWEEPGRMLVSLLEHVRPLAMADGAAAAPPAGE